MFRRRVGYFVGLRQPHHMHSLYQSKTAAKGAPARPPASTRVEKHDETPSHASSNLFQQIREAKPAVRYTVYAGLSLMATVESTFWFKVLKAKFLPLASEEQRQKADQFLEDIKGAVKGYRKVWMSNYGRYYGAYAWGLSYGGLDGLKDEPH